MVIGRDTGGPDGMDPRPLPADSPAATVPSVPGPAGDADGPVPSGWRVAASASWRFLVILAAVGVIAYILGYLAVVIVPVAIALLLAALLHPLVSRLAQWHVPRGLAVALVVIGGVCVIGGVLTGVITAFVNGLPMLQVQIGQSMAQINGWLARGPLHLPPHALQTEVGKLLSNLKSQQGRLLSGAVTTAVTVGEVLTELALTVFTLVFLLKDGPAIWRFLTRAVPVGQRSRVYRAGQAAFTGLTHYIRAIILVAAGDAIGIGIGLVAVGVPLALPLAALVFLGAFIPIAGSVTAGAVAVLVTLVTNGLVPALIVLAVVIAVMQLEGNVLQPLLLGRAVRLHPLAIVLAIATGVVIAGIVGALLAVPLLTVPTTAVRSLLGEPPPLLRPDPSDRARLAAAAKRIRRPPHRRRTPPQ